MPDRGTLAILRAREEELDMVVRQRDELRIKYADLFNTAAALEEALAWIHIHLGSECDWDELDDDSIMEARWYRDVTKLLTKPGSV